MALSWEVDREIYQIFIQETLQLLEKIEAILVGFDRNGDLSKIEELVRAAHTIKGGAAQIQFTETHTIAARLETFFRRLKNKDCAIDLELLNFLIAGYELLRLSVLTRIENNGTLDNNGDLLARSESIFIQLDALLGDRAIVDDHNIPKITDVEPNIKELICNTEIAEAIEDLEQILARATDEELLIQLQAQISIFLDLGKILGISEFIAIAQTSQATLEVSPQAARNLGQLAKVGFQAALQAVLNDNNSQLAPHDSPSPARVDRSKISLTGDKENSEAELFAADLEPIIFRNAILEAESAFLEENNPPQPRKQPKLPSLAVKTELRYNASKSLIWRSGNNVFILPYKKIAKNLSSKFVKFIYSDEDKYLRSSSQLLQVYQLSELLSYKYPGMAIEASKPKKDSSILIVNHRSLVLALEVRIDLMITASELIIKPFSAALSPPNYIYGCTILPDLSLACAIDVPLLLSLTLDRRGLVTDGDSTNDRKPPTILVVDDSSAWRQILSVTLAKNGYDVIQAKDGTEAIERLQKKPQIQLIVSDLEMPHLNGFELLAYCRQELLLTELPFILLTTRSSDRYRHQAKELGATDYFTKPYDESEFLTTLQSYLSNLRDRKQKSC